MKTLYRLAWVAIALGLCLAGSSFAQTKEGRFKEEELAPLPIYLRGFAVSKQVVNGNIYVFGGVDRDNKVSDRIYRYALFTGQWNELPQRLPYPYAAQNASAVLGPNGKLYLGPGFSSITRSPTHAGIIEFDPVSARCTEIQGFASPRGDVAAEQASDGMIYFFGGWDGLGRSEVYHFDPTSRTLTQVAELGFPRGAISAVMADDENIYLFGGNPIRSVIERFDTRRERIELQSGTLPAPVVESRGAPLVWSAGGSKVYLLPPGGGDVYTYDFSKEELTRSSYSVAGITDYANVVVSEDASEVYFLQADRSRLGQVRLTAMKVPMRELASEVKMEGRRTPEKTIPGVQEETPGGGIKLVIGGGYSRIISPKQLTNKPTSFTGVQDNLSGGLDSPGLLSGFNGALQVKFRIASWLRLTTSVGINQWRSKTPITSGTDNVGQITSTISSLLVGLGPELELAPSSFLSPYLGGEAVFAAFRTEAKLVVTGSSTSRTTQEYLRGGAAVGAGILLHLTSAFGLEVGAKYYIPNLLPKKTEDLATDKFETIVRDQNSLAESKISFLWTFGGISFSF